MPSKLQIELKKKRGFVSVEQEMVLNLARTYDRVMLRIERLLREYGLTGSQYNVLRILRGEGTPLPTCEIASRTVQVLPGITGLIDRLEKAGLVERIRSEQDRRQIYVAITPAGLKLLARLDAPLPALERKLLGGLTRGEQKEFIRLMEKIRLQMEENCQL